MEVSKYLNNLNGFFNSLIYFFCSGESKVALAKIDPLQIQRMQIKQGGNSAVNLDLTFNNVELHGLKDFHCTSVK